MRTMIGVDVGGTFTDVVRFDGTEIQGKKVPTTHPQADGVVGSLEGDHGDVFLHGTTAATNALLEEAGAKVGFVTNSGYEGLIEIGRQDRPALYDMSVDRPTPLVSRDMRFGYDGDTTRLLEALGRDLPEVVAVGLIESHADPSDEAKLVAAISRRLDVPVLSSSEVSPEFREYERFATTVLSAYLTPSVAGYLRALDERIAIPTRLIMTSSGGLLPFSTGHRSAGRLVLSGPAGGVVAAAGLGSHHGHETVLSFDMGGTSTDVCRISGGRLAVGSGHSVGGRVNRVPAVPVQTIGAGGGSIAWVDAGGSLRVGPRSAGSMPGPAAYGQGGTAPTVTDANLLVGNIPRDLRLGGTVPLESRLAEEAVDSVATEAGLSMKATAEGIIEIVDSHMEHALRSVSVEEGADPRQAVIVAFGGAGGLHASRLARRLGIEKVLIPPLSGVFSALGLLLSSPRADSARTVMLAEDETDLAGEINRVLAEAKRSFERTFGSEPSETAANADVRYVGQSHELEIDAAPAWTEMRAAFEKAHHETFGFNRPGESIEVVNVRAAANGDAPMAWADIPGVDSDLDPVDRDGVWDRATLPPGFVIKGPALVVETNSAILVEGGDSLTVLEDGTLEITR